MKRAIVDYKKLTKDILALLVEKYPEGYQDRDVIRFKNAKNETVEALEVRTEDTIYLVKVSTRLASTMERYDEDDEDGYHYYNREEDDNEHNDDEEYDDKDNRY